MTPLIPAGVSAGENRAGEAASAPVRSQGLAGGSPCPALHPGPSDSSDSVPGALAASVRGGKRKIKQLCGHFFSLGLAQGLMLTRFKKKKQQKLASLDFSPSSRRISLSEGKTTNSSRPLSLHPPTPKLGALKEGVGGGASLSLGPLACGGLITPISG